MTRTVLTLGLAGLCNQVATPQQPMIIEGPVNAASYAAAGLPNSGISQGSMFVIKGQGLGAPGTAIATSFPLQATMGGASIRITVGGATVDALMIYVVAGRPEGPDQIAAIAPSNTPLGSGAVTVAYNGRSSATAPIRIVRSAFGIFTRNQAGTGPGIVQNFNSPADTPTNSLVEVAHPDQVLILWGTGLLAVSGDEAARPLPEDLDVPVDVFVGGKRANVIYKGRSGCCAGIDQISFVAPPGVRGCYIPVAVQAAGVLSNFVTISINSSGKFCSDTIGSFSLVDLQKVQAGETLAVADITLNRGSAKVAFPAIGTIQGNIDFGLGHFRRYRSAADVLASVHNAAGLRGVPSLGSCVVWPYSFSGEDIIPVGAYIQDPVISPGLDAGAALNLNGPRGAKQLPRQSTGSGGYEYTTSGEDGLIGGGFPGITSVQPDYLQPGNYTVDNGPGGADVGAFRASLTIPSNQPVWRNQDAIGTIPRSQDLTVTWSGGEASVVVFGSSGDPATRTGAQFLCHEPGDSGRITVPAWVLSALPASGQLQGVPVGFLALVTLLQQPSSFRATGIDVGIFTWGALQLKNVTFQ